MNFVALFNFFRREKEFKVSIKFAAKADIHHLKQFLQSRQSDVPQETIQALDVVLRTNPSAKYVPLCSIFFFFFPIRMII